MLAMPPTTFHLISSDGKRDLRKGSQRKTTKQRNIKGRQTTTYLTNHPGNSSEPQPRFSKRKWFAYKAYALSDSRHNYSQSAFRSVG